MVAMGGTVTNETLSRFMLEGAIVSAEKPDDLYNPGVQELLVPVLQRL